MNFRERTLAIFAHRPVDNIVYQPRIEHWYGINQRDGTLPERYKDLYRPDTHPVVQSPGLARSLEVLSRALQDRFGS